MKLKNTNTKTVTMATALMLLVSLPFAAFAQYEENRGLFGRGPSAANVEYSTRDGLIGINDNTGGASGGITCLGDATIILKDGTTNTVKHYGNYYPGIFVPENKTLTIQGNTGSLSVRGEYGAAIGSGDSSSGTYASCGDITITSDVSRVTATTEMGYNSIGKGESSNACGTVTIGGIVYYDGSSYQNGGNTYLASKPLIYSAYVFPSVVLSK